MRFRPFRGLAGQEGIDDNRFAGGLVASLGLLHDDRARRGELQRLWREQRRRRIEERRWRW
jgi:hypothetical protein